MPQNSVRGAELESTRISRDSGGLGHNFLASEASISDKVHLIDLTGRLKCASARRFRRVRRIMAKTIRHHLLSDGRNFDGKSASSLLIPQSLGARDDFRKYGFLVAAEIDLGQNSRVRLT
jgi:hypothetical protein